LRDVTKVTANLAEGSGAASQEIATSASSGDFVTARSAISAAPSQSQEEPRTRPPATRARRKWAFPVACGLVREASPQSSTPLHHRLRVSVFSSYAPSPLATGGSSRAVPGRGTAVSTPLEVAVGIRSAMKPITASRGTPWSRGAIDAAPEAGSLGTPLSRLGLHAATGYRGGARRNVTPNSSGRVALRG
jgi:hypothetical protein